MPFDSGGTYIPVDGAITAAPGQLIQSAIWNAIFTDMDTALTSLGSQFFGTAAVASFQGTTQATATTTAAVKIAGGLGVVKNAFIGGRIVAGNQTLTTAQDVNITSDSAAGTNVWIESKLTTGFASLLTGNTAFTNYNQFITFGTAYPSNRFGTITGAGLNEFSAQGTLVIGTVPASTLYFGTNNVVRAQISSGGDFTIASLTATPAGGSTAARLLFGTTSGFGIYYGSGAPTVSAAQGSIYLRSDGSSTSTRMYVNTTGSTTWTNVTTAA
jgi:hypothetical protein